MTDHDQVMKKFSMLLTEFLESQLGQETVVLRCFIGDPLIPSFEHFSDNQERVFIILDPCHMIEFVRNSLADLKDFKGPEGNIIK